MTNEKQWQEAWDRAVNASQDPLFQWILEEARKPYWLGTLPRQHELDRPVLLDLDGLKIKRYF